MQIVVRSNKAFWSLFVFLSVMIVSCVHLGCDTSGKRSASEKPGANGKSSGAVSDKLEANVTEEEVQQFAKDWAACIETPNVEQAKRLVAWRTIAERAIESFDLSAADKRSFVDDVDETSATMHKVMSNGVANGGSYRLVRTRERSGFKHAVFRLLGSNGAMNYHELRIVRLNGEVRADHFYVAATGEGLSDTLRNAVAPVITGNQSLVTRLSGEAKRNLEVLRQQKEMSEAIQAGQNEKALAIYDSLPADVKTRKLPLLHRVMAIDVANEADYLAAIDDYVKHFPNDASLGLLTLDSAALRGDAELLIKSRDQLAGWTGGDPYIDLLVGGILANFGEVEQAVEMTKDIDPLSVGIASAHEFKLNVALADGNHAEVLQQLRVMRDDYEIEFGDLRRVEGFEGFTNSPQFEEWTADN